MRLFLYLIFFLVTNYLSAQSLVDKLYDPQAIDSIASSLSHAKGASRLGLLNVLAEAYWFHNPDVTLKYANEALVLSRESGDKEAEAYALINLCQGYLLKDIYHKALEYGLKSLEIRQKLNQQEEIAYTLRTLGWLYYDIEDSELALEYHEKVLEIHKKLNDQEKIAYSHNSLGLVYAQKNEHENAIELFLQSLQYNESVRKSDRVSENLKNIGISYSALEKYEVAMKYLIRAALIFEQAKDYYRLAQVYNELAFVYTNLGQLTLAQKILMQVDPIISNLSDNQELRLRHYQVSSYYYEKIGNDELALSHYRKYTDIYNQVLSREQNHRLAQMRVTHESEKRQGEIKILEQEKELAELKRQGWMIGIILLLVIAILVVTRMRSSFRKRKAIYEANQSLAVERLKNEKLVQKNLKNELHFKSQELVNFGLHISQKNELYINFIKQLQELEFLNKFDARAKIRSLIKYFSQQLKFNETLDDYEANPEYINDDFFYRLQTKFPNLTDHDKRLVAQLRRKLCSKEISALNNISVKSVEISRYRLRKKLKLRKGQNLVEFIQTI